MTPDEIAALHEQLRRFKATYIYWEDDAEPFDEVLDALDEAHSYEASGNGHLVRVKRPA